MLTLGAPPHLLSESERGYSGSAASAPLEFPGDIIGDGGRSHVDGALFRFSRDVVRVVRFHRGDDLV